MWGTHLRDRHANHQAYGIHPFALTGTFPRAQHDLFAQYATGFVGHATRETFVLVMWPRAALSDEHEVTAPADFSSPALHQHFETAAELRVDDDAGVCEAALAAPQQDVSAPQLGADALPRARENLESLEQPLHRERIHTVCRGVVELSARIRRVGGSGPSPFENVRHRKTPRYSRRSADKL
jgi:hypothetical protein